jgi:hypothetical protein
VIVGVRETLGQSAKVRTSRFESSRVQAADRARVVLPFSRDEVQSGRGRPEIGLCGTLVVGDQQGEEVRESFWVKPPPLLAYAASCRLLGLETF